MPNIKEMSKKELKEYINTNGGFLNMKLNFIDKEKTNKKRDAYKDKIPAWATYFEAIASNGDLNRNGYIIRPQAWENAIPTFLEYGSVLYQHDANKPIGKPLDAKVTDKGELWVAWYILDTNNYSEWNIINGNVTGISTGHITESVEFQNEKTGEVLSEEEFLKEHEYIDMWRFGTYITPGWILAVTKADWLEFSFVTLASNRKSKVKFINGILNYLSSKGIECKAWDEDGLSKNLLEQGVESLKMLLNNPELSEKAKEHITNKINEVEWMINEPEEESEQPQEVVEEKISEEPKEEVVEEKTNDVEEEEPNKDITDEEEQPQEEKEEQWEVEKNDCSWDCEDCPEINCEDNETPKEDNNIEEEPKEEVIDEDNPSDEPISEEQPQEELVKENNEVETDEEPENPETDSWDTVADEGGDNQAQNKSVETNAKTVVEDNAIKQLKEENSLLKKENETLQANLDEANKLLEDGAKTIEKLSVLVERAQKFSKEQWLNFTQDTKKSILEQRMKVIN